MISTAELQASYENSTQNEIILRMAEVRVAVLLCTYNGEKHLEEQLDSIAKQGLPFIDIWVSDDGSTDSTVSLLEKYKQNWTKGRFVIKSGPRKGFAANFLSLVCNSELEADYFAFCDQDDIWQRDKLSRAVKFLASNPRDKATLYCSRTSLVTESGEPMGVDSPLFIKQPSFRNALVQSLAGGNTMVFNQQTKSLLSEVGMLEIVSHDWWTYMLVSGAGGQVIYDEMPTILYRQHDDNEIGANMNWSARMSRVVLLLAGRFKEWNEINIRALEKAKPLLTDENQKTLKQFTKLREANLLERLKLAKNAKLYRQTFFGDIALIGATILKKL